MTLAPTLPLSEYSKIVEKAVMEINSSIERFNKRVNAYNKARPDQKKEDIRKTMTREEINNLIARTCRTYRVKESFIRRIGHFEKIEGL